MIQPRVTSNEQLAAALLSITEPVPLRLDDMARSLELTFFPPHEHSPRLDHFASRLKSILTDLGATVSPYEETLLPGEEEKIEPGAAILEQGEGEDGHLAIDHVTSLYENPLTAIYDRPCPVKREASLQDKLDAIVGVLAWNLTHIPIFLEEDAWTICTMNGGIIRCEGYDTMREDVLHALVPKLTAQVTPPKRSDLKMREGALDVAEEGYLPFVRDFMDSASIWEQNGLMLSHTSLDDLTYRNRYYRRIVSAYLNHRTGMSYGFMARQLPTSVAPAIRQADAPARLRAVDWWETPLHEVEDTLYAAAQLGDERWIVPVPDVWVLSTRSGCEKTNLDAQQDIVRMGLCRGEVVFDTPAGIDAASCRPSYDTLAILSHAAGNAVAASILRALRPDAQFPDLLEEEGLSISHWHGYPGASQTPTGYVLHGQDNPPVSCSTPQSAVYAFTGKLDALAEHLHRDTPYCGDVHVEPHHGTNITGCRSLSETAAWVDQHHHDEPPC